MTINQALDQVFVAYKSKDMAQYPDIQKLKLNLIELKINCGGNTQIENVSTVKNVIKYGSINPDNWQD